MVTLVLLENRKLEKLSHFLKTTHLKSDRSHKSGIRTVGQRGPHFFGHPMVQCDASHVNN